MTPAQIENAAKAASYEFVQLLRLNQPEAVDRIHILHSTIAYMVLEVVTNSTMNGPPDPDLNEHRIQTAKSLLETVANLAMQQVIEALLR